jgi:tRNA-2-methylthio-N6-dimethylallyladenosine synthase
MEHIEVPVQAGDDEVLRRMKRGYTADDYRRLVGEIRERVPGVAIHSDVIVGFCGETAAQFERTREILAELRLDKVHLAKFSPRPGTVAAKLYADDVSEAEKKRRHRVLDELQAEVSAEINARHLGRTVEVLVEDEEETASGRRWRSRTRTNKLVFFDEPGGADRRGELVDVEITWTGPWSMVGRPAGAAEAPRAEREVIPLEIA